jgi:hypothetical protein
MDFRRKQSQGRIYLQIVESQRTGDQVRQRVIATLGRLDELEASGQLGRLLRSGARFVQQAMVLDAARTGDAPAIAVRRIGPALLFERLWAETGCQNVITTLARRRGHRFAIERAVFLTVLHRLMRGGSDLAAERWREEYRIAGSDGLDLHHLYRAMAWLGEELPTDQQAGATPFAPRCTKDLIEEQLFAHRRDLFSRLDLVFMDTTSLYFEGLGGQSIGQYGYSKDHRPDLRQIAKAESFMKTAEGRGRLPSGLRNVRRCHCRGARSILEHNLIRRLLERLLLEPPTIARAPLLVAREYPTVPE